MARRLNATEAKQRAGKFCAFRERSPNEVLEKLKAWGLEEAQAMRILAELSAEGYVDEQRFANAFCNDKFEFNAWGKQKIKAHIHVHNISGEVLQKALDRIDAVKYQEKLISLASGKWHSLEQEDPQKRKQKTVAYLVNKGFEMDLIWETVNKLHPKGH